MGLTIGLAALARAERHRRTPRSRPAARDRHFGLLPHETPARGLKRIMLAQLDLAIELLRGEAAIPAAERVHETRKALKRVRALLRLLEDELGHKRCARAQSVLRDAAARLAQARDAEVMVSRLEQLLRRHPRRLRRRRALIGLREALERERVVAQAAHAQASPVAISSSTRSGPAGHSPVAAAGAPASNGSAATAGPAGNARGNEHVEIAAELAVLRARIDGWELRDRSLERLVQPGLRRIYRKGRSRWARAAARKPSPTALHRWRKEVKDLRYVIEVLDPHPSRLTKLARRADTLGELLGQEHDLALLAERVRAHAPLKRHKRARRALLRTIARRRARLRERALRKGARLYGHKPKRFARRVQAKYRGSAPA